MRRTLLILSLLSLTLFAGCGERNSAVTNATSSANATVNQGTGATAGSGPQNQGIGGNTNGGAVNGNTYTVPPGFNKNGDRGSASTISNTP